MTFYTCIKMTKTYLCPITNNVFKLVIYKNGHFTKTSIVNKNTKLYSDLYSQSICNKNNNNKVNIEKIHLLQRFGQHVC